MDLKEEMRSEPVSHLDLSGFVMVNSGTPVREVISLMQQKGAKVCLVAHDEHLIGIFTVRDVLRKVVSEPSTWDKPIDDVMTPNPITITLEASAADALWLMNEKRIRDLPALDNSGKIVGNMTNQTIINYLAARYPTDILNFPPRPDQFPDQVEGG
jgi:CBS domain-containing protein